ncbi:uncharacterized protein SPPG_05305 [Spizellomyces punctatus DAOM BR117]|uniref:Secreted protein n=1 Tax=Spizellomyces punctatus (strain DAOM BR117) TaxID=645134 RepID=A0A0L0HGH1_SPIPD|nr:uncharacterized protein SPPG_05305 [Spizellomyces punctatus DAOM BR117]KNC99933.1 secreted protein [Spizellomyces punctatus DAOM BR117]|eukprot:XP_016607973.1 secreted protein [Spizellomyces punctatus DAOM BR117]
MKLTTILPLVALAATAASAAPTEPTPDPNQVYVKGVSYNGSGCPISPPSAQVVLADDKKSFTVLFDKFIASAGPGIPRTENRKNCQLTVQLHIPGGWQYSIASADFRGWAELDKDVTGRQQSIYYFQGDGRTTTTEMSVNGPIAKNYAIRDEIDFTSQSWSPCGEDRPVNINTSIFVSNTKNPKAGGVLTTDSVDGKIVQKYQFQWKKCPQAKA